MASYLGILDNQPDYVNPLNLQLLDSVMRGKQGRFDQNVAQIDQTLAELKIQENLLLRPEDREIFANKAQSLIDSVNRSGGMDVSSNGLTRQIKGQIKSVLDDDYLISQIGNSQKIRSAYTQVAELQKKDPKLYSDINFDFALTQAGVDKYLKGESNEVGNVQYHNYTDVTENLLKKVKDLKELKGEQVIEVEDPENPGKIIRTSINGLTEQQIFDYIPGILTADEQKQLAINGWAKYKDSPDVAINDFNAYKNILIPNFDKNIEYENSILQNSATSAKERKESQLRLQAYQNNKKQALEEFDSVDLNNVTVLGGFLEKANWKTSFAKMAQSEFSREIEKNEYYFANASLEIQQAQEERLTAELQLKIQQESGVTGGSSADISVSAREGALQDEIQPFNTLEKDYREMTGALVSEIYTASQSPQVPEDTKKQYVLELQKRGYNQDGSVKDAELASKNPKSLAMKTAFDNSGMGRFLGDVSKKLTGLEIKRNALATEYWDVKETTLLPTFEKNADSYISSFNTQLRQARSDSQTDLSDEIGIQNETIVAEAEKFIKDNGGQQKLKQVLSKDSQKLEQFSIILNKLNNRSTPWTSFIPNTVAGIVSRDLKADSLEEANKELNKRTTAGQNASFNTLNIATIGNEKVRERIVGMLPQTADTPLFDPKNPISFERTPTGDIKVIQNKGYTSGQKQSMLRDAEVTVSSDDAVFKELVKYIDLTDKERGLDASRTKIKVKPTGNIGFIEDSKKAIISKIDNDLSTLSPNIVQGFLAHPARFMTKERTYTTYKAVITGVTDEKLKSFVNTLEDNMGSFVPELKPFGDQWALSLTTKKGKVINEGGTGMKYLEDDLAYLVKNYPQAVISEGILRYIRENPQDANTRIDEILNYIR